MLAPFSAVDLKVPCHSPEQKLSLASSFPYFPFILISSFFLRLICPSPSHFRFSSQWPEVDSSLLLKYLPTPSRHALSHVVLFHRAILPQSEIYILHSLHYGTPSLLMLQVSRSAHHSHVFTRESASHSKGHRVSLLRRQQRYRRLAIARSFASDLRQPLHVLDSRRCNDTRVH